MWGVFDALDTHGELHVMPCDTHGQVLGGHVASWRCQCEPQIVDGCDPRTHRLAFTHNDSDLDS
jgi:hypothetical protein